VFRDTVFEWLPLIAVLLLRWLVLPYEVWSSFWNRMPVSLEESGWLAGQPWWGTLTQLLWKHGAAPFAASVLLTACFAINDLSVFVLLAPPGFSTTTLNIFSAVHYGPSSYLAALSLCQVLIVAALATTALSLGFQPTRAAR
jgi:ABC-type Fe3+ transport system permease subunit